MNPPDYCHCGSNSLFLECCTAIFTGSRQAETAEALMRSRYTAFVTGNECYLLRSWHPTTRPAVLELDGDQRWLGLSIKRTEKGLAEDETGVVEFVARYKIAGKGHRLHEVSQFRRMAGRWYYVSGAT